MMCVRQSQPDALDLALRGESLMMQGAIIAEKEAEGCKRIAAMLRHDEPRVFREFMIAMTSKAIRLREKALPLDQKTALTLEAARFVRRNGAIGDLDVAMTIRFVAWAIGQELARIEKIVASKVEAAAEAESDPDE
jgi:hypothetical protein